MPAPSWAVAAVILAFSIVFFANAAAAAHGKPFWHDEIFTILFARFPSIPDMWRAALDGLDLMPPLNAFVTHGLHSVVGEGPVLTRLPPMLGVWIMCLAVFAIVRRRSNLTLALGAAMLPAWTAASRYGVEARGYGLMLGCFGLAALAWSDAAGGRRRRACLPLLALSLGAGAWAHYYGILNAAPLAAGELVRDVRRRQPDWGIWAAFGAGFLLMLPLAQLAGVALARAGRSWTLLQPSGLRDTYAFLFSPLLDLRLLGVVVLATALGWLERIVVARPPEAITIAVHEVVAGVVCLLLPLVGVVARDLGLGMFVPRYGLSAVVGFCVLAPLLVWVGSGRSRAVALAACAWLFLGAAHSAWTARSAAERPYPNPLAQRPLLSRAIGRGERVCISGGLMYLQFWYYAPPLLRSRLCYLADPDAARRLADSDSLDNGLLALRRWTAVTVHDYDRFIEAHASFTVYGAGSGWLLQRLGESGASVRETGTELGARLYEVTLRRPR